MTSADFIKILDNEEFLATLSFQFFIAASMLQFIHKKTEDNDSAFM